MQETRTQRASKVRVVLFRRHGRTQTLRIARRVGETDFASKMFAGRFDLLIRRSMVDGLGSRI